jgi:uncharacterized protein (TIGR02285 family)
LRRTLRLSCWVVLALSTGQAWAEGPAATHETPSAAPAITWAVIDRPPIYILKHEGTSVELDGGIGDQLLRLYWKALPGYRHRVDEMNSTRLWRAVESRDDTTCFVGAIRNPERDRIAYYTGGVLGYPLRIVTTEANAVRMLGNHSRVSLASLIRDTRFHGLRVSDRAYGEDIDRIIREAGPEGSLEAVTIHDSGPSLVRQVALGRADWTIEFGITVRYLEKTGALPAATLVTLPISESNTLNRAGIACSRTPVGHAVIEQLDRFIAANVARAPYRRAIESWLSPAEERELRDQLEVYRHDRAGHSDTNF